MDCRYLGQGYELRIPIPGREISEPDLDQLAADFHAAHAREYGHNFPDDPVEFVNLRSSVAGPPANLAAISESKSASTPVDTGRRGTAWFYVNNQLVETTVRYIDRESLGEAETLAGPIVLCQEDATLVVPPDWLCARVPGGSFELMKKGTHEG